MTTESITQTHCLHLTTDDQHPSPYYLMPFDVPNGIASLTIRYEFASASDASKVGKESGSIVDLGLFDPRGCELLTAEGFRGWSGSARPEATLAQARATPGYLPGPIYPGTWHALLGLYQIAPEGCDVTVTITLTPGEGTEASSFSPAPLYSSIGVVRDRPSWYRGDLHCHTHHSDATADVATLAAVARAQGLDFLAITDHNTVSHLPELAQHGGPDLLLIPGIEVTTYRGHANVWGVRVQQEFRAETGEEICQIREQVREQGLLFSINHPKEGGPDWEFESAVDADAVEAWQAPWWLSNYVSLGFWDRLLRQGYRPTLVGGSDKHQGPFDGTLSLYEIGTPTTWVYAQALSEQAILDGIRQGHVYVSQEPSVPVLSFTAEARGQAVMMGDALHVCRGETVTFACQVGGAEKGWLLRVMNRAGEVACVPIKGDAWTYRWEVVAQVDDYYRLEVIEPPLEPLEKEPSALFCFALSNPVYIRIER